MNKENYVLIAKIGLHDNCSDGYYTGKSFIFQGVRYAIVNQDILLAKLYSNKVRAEKASKMEFENYQFEVEVVNN